MKVTLRAAAEKDRRFVWLLRNAPDVRAVSGDPRPIPWTDAPEVVVAMRPGDDVDRAVDAVMTRVTCHYELMVVRHGRAPLRLPGEYRTSAQARQHISARDDLFAGEHLVVERVRVYIERKRLVA